MEMNIVSDNENKLLGRREIKATASSTDKTPTKESVKEDICKKLSLDPELVEIREIKQHYGVRMSDILAYSYANKDIMSKSIRKSGEKGKKPAATSGAGAAPAKK